MGQFSVEKPQLTGSVLSGNRHGDYPDFAQALEFWTSALGSGKEEGIRFIAPDNAPEAQIKQLVELGAWQKT